MQDKQQFRLQPFSFYPTVNSYYQQCDDAFLNISSSVSVFLSSKQTSVILNSTQSFTNSV
ncbi:hypothetical protein EXN66_Car013995 [Channa argus]|uniref:Uncharacterized protein n=1 Tax=Channa argus TaxID=215402 RepID=A0A6G1Q7D1_CHAAH|nr:hypothetical protein EXN66_Car013995 [Channa argus]